MNIKVGDFVGFKSDIEQSAEVIEIKVRRIEWSGKSENVYVVKAGPDGFQGEYINGCATTELWESDLFSEY